MDIGLINRGHRKKILVEIEKLPPEEMDQEVPVSFLPINSVTSDHGRVEQYTELSKFGYSCPLKPFMPSHRGNRNTFLLKSNQQY